MARMSPRWNRQSTHSGGCGGCARAADSAKNDAIGNGLDEATYTFTHAGIEHTTTVHRPATRNTETREKAVKPMKVKVVLEFEIEPEVWANEYGLDLDNAKEDARGYFPELVREYMRTMPHVSSGVVDYIRKA